MIEQGALLLLAAVVVGSALGVVLARSAIYSALFLIVNLFGLAICFLLIHAVFLAAAQVLIYAGAIVVLFLFAITLLNPGGEQIAQDPHAWQRGLAIGLGAILGAMLIFLLARSLGPLVASLPGGVPVSHDNGSVEGFGTALFEQFVYPFELTSFILLVALLGAVVISRRDLGADVGRRRVPVAGSAPAKEGEQSR
jgi:NADH-quinone oxidoreductase subunit J